QPVAAVPAIPAGEYVVSARRTGGDGWIMVGIGADQFALVTEPAAAFDAGVPLRFPLDVRAVVVRADEDARRALEAIDIRPVRLVGKSDKLTADVALRAVRYGTTLAFFTSDRSFPEPAGFWVGG